MRVIEDNYTLKEQEMECIYCNSKIGVEYGDVTFTGGADFEVYWVCPLCKNRNYADARDWTGYDNY